MTAGRQEGRVYMLLDSGNNPLAKGSLENALTDPNLRVEVLDNKADEVAEHAIINLVAMRSADQSFQCQMLRQRGDTVILKIISKLDRNVRRNLRVPVKFDSFLYPITGQWRGRRAVQTTDLSSGGVAFRGAPGLEMNEEMEVIVPAMEGPLILRCEILRIQDLEDGNVFYATKFVDLCEDEEVAVREAVFFLQLENRDLHTAETGR